ncbi:unnamed protein product [Linum tenue]|uniref:Uncharacterized protein n=1 Tax=Linum tenue TaxID=586396 RepID=A0AAV0IZS9_9ROSI|nr:unnamed protein product [Linum tenue]
MRKLMKATKKSQKSGSNKFQENVRRKETGKEEPSAAELWDLGSPLYDSHEVVSVIHLIDRHLMALPSSLGNGGSKRLSRKFSSSTLGRKQAVVVPAPPSPTSSTGGGDNDETIAAAGGGGGSSEDRRSKVGGMLGFVGKKLRNRNEKKKKISRRSGKEGKQQRPAKGKKSAGVIIACFGRKKC